MLISSFTKRFLFIEVYSIIVVSCIPQFYEYSSIPLTEMVVSILIYFVLSLESYFAYIFVTL